MKFQDILRGHVPLREEVLAEIWDEAIFCFDTNVLLDVYRYSEINRASFLKLLTAIKDRIFVPNQVAVEFARNRVTTIREHYAAHRMIRQKLVEATAEIEKSYGRHDLEELKRFLEDSKERMDAFLEPENDQLKNDHILESVIQIIGDDIADPIKKEELEKEYEIRKKKLIPPFCEKDDQKDEERRIGDVAIWMELLNHMGKINKPLIFVTEDQKANWWHKEGGQHIPQPRLVQEMFRASGKDVVFMRSVQFSKQAPERLNIVVSEGFADETEKLREQQDDSSQGGLYVAIKEGEIWKAVPGVIHNEGKPSIWVEGKPLEQTEDELLGRVLCHAVTDIKQAWESNGITRVIASVTKMGIRNGILTHVVVEKDVPIELTRQSP